MKEKLTHDSLEEAAKATVYAIGVPKTVGAMLWPADDITRVASKLNNKLDPNRAEVLHTRELLFIAREGVKIGVHYIGQYMNGYIGYPDPVEGCKAGSMNEKLDRLLYLAESNELRAVS